MKMVIIDIEANGLLDSVSKIHCLSYHCLDDGTSGSFTKYEDILDFLEQEITIIGHNFVRYDIPAIRKILGFKGEIPLIDTLALSWYLYPDRNTHGLEGWGEDFGVPKPKVEDFIGLGEEKFGIIKYFEDLYDK